MKFFTRIKERYQRITDALAEWFFGDIQYFYYDVPVYPDAPRDEVYVERRRVSRKKEYVDEPVKVEEENGENDVNVPKMLCVVCEDCHEEDRPITKCFKRFDSHTTSTNRMKCDVCGRESKKLVYCRNYIKAFGKKSFMDQEIN